MSFNRLFLITCLICLNLSAYTQSRGWCLTGKVLDAENGLPVPDAHVTTPTYERGAVTDAQGLFELCGLNEEQVELLVFHTAYEKQMITADKNHPRDLIVELSIKDYQTQEVTVVSSNASIVKNYIPGKLTLKKEDVLSVPTLLGTPDVVRTLQLMPGIQSVNEGNSGIYVRGGSPGQNLILFDDIELMNPSHLMGIYSVFNPLLTDRVEFFKGNAPIHQSTRLASSIIVHTRDQKETKSNWAGNLGNISTNLTYNGQSKNDKWYFSCGIRRSYIDLLKYMVKPLVSDENNYFEKNNYNFYDFNGKLLYKTGKSRLALTWYVGEDIFNLHNEKNHLAADTRWGNQGAVFSWKLLLSSGFTMKNSIGYSGYQSKFAVDFTDNQLRFNTDYQQYNFKSDFLLEKDKHLLRWGLNVSRYHVSPQDLDVSLFSNQVDEYDLFNGLSNKVYLSDHVTLSDKLSLYGGVAFEYYAQLGPYTYEQNGHVDRYRAGEVVDHRAQCNAVCSFNYYPSPLSSIKGSYTYGTQNMHLASIATIPLPTDMWMPATRLLPPETGHQATLGYFRQLPVYGIQYGVEAYGKLLDEQLLFKVNVDNEDILNFEDNFYSGKGMAYGVEVFLKETKGKFQYTLGYTLGWARQKFATINEGQWYDAKYDRRHDLNLLCTYRLNDRIDFGGVFIFATGNKATLPTGRYWMMGDVVNDYQGVNNYRMPAYHRLDLSMNYRLKSKTFHESILNFSIINLYNRANPYFIYYYIDNGEKDYELAVKAKQISLFPIMPSVSWRFKF
ncbi:TonB-dependent receptor [Marinilabiliaceae bacterium JC017]|nr:TonB-dependent receptor [Marinilabiliaceae bacterium JC017]